MSARLTATLQAFGRPVATAELAAALGLSCRETDQLIAQSRMVTYDGGWITSERREGRYSRAYDVLGVSP